MVGEFPDECTAYQIFFSEGVSLNELKILSAFKEKNKEARVVVYYLGLHERKACDFQCYPLEKIVRICLKKKAS